jgi:hypothetical protein
MAGPYEGGTTVMLNSTNEATNITCTRVPTAPEAFARAMGHASIEHLVRATVATGSPLPPPFVTVKGL